MYIGIGLAVVFVIILWFSYRRRQLRRELEQLRISVPDLHQRMQQGETLTILDLRHPLEVLTAPQTIPGAVTIDPQSVDERTAAISRNAKIVLFCTCPNEETSLKAYRQMKNRGFRHLHVLTGGLPAWKAAELPLQDLYPDVKQSTSNRLAAS